MHTKFFSGLFVLIIFQSNFALAQYRATEGPYGGIGLINHSIDDTNNVSTSDSLGISGTEVTIGYRFSRSLSGELSMGNQTLDGFNIPYNSSTIAVLPTDSTTTKFSVLSYVKTGSRQIRPFFRLGSASESSDPVVAIYQGDVIAVNVENESGTILGLGADYPTRSGFLRFEAVKVYADETIGFSIGAFIAF